MALGAIGCADLPETDAPVLSSSTQALYLAGSETFPGRSVPVCFTPEAVARSDFAALSARTKAAVNRTWTQATGLRFTGWGQCPFDTPGSVVISIGDGAGNPNTFFGYNAAWPTSMELKGNKNAQWEWEAIAVHEFGHALGFQHEMVRPDFTDGARGSFACSERNASGGNTFNTPANDWRSVMTASYCQGYVHALGTWDAIGSQNAYGHPNYFADVNADGFADAILVNPGGIFVRKSNTLAFSATNRNFTGGAFRGTKGTYFADVNNDRRADAIAVNDDAVWIRSSDGNNFPASTLVRATDVPFFGMLGTFFVDVSGDGRADAIAIQEDGIYVRTAATNRTFPASTQRRWTGAFFGNLGMYFADVNYDNRADAIAVTTTGIKVRLSTGSAFGSEATWSSTYFGGDRGTHFADVDWDGRADAIAVNTNGIRVRRSLGNAFGVEEVWTSTGYFGERGTMFADVDGWGADAIAVNEGGISVAVTSWFFFDPFAPNWTGGAYYGQR